MDIYTYVCIHVYYDVLISGKTTERKETEKNKKQKT